jgi:hypothetical protein
MIIKILTGTASFLLIAVCISCGSSSPNDPVISDGNWSGSILGQAVTFTVDGSQVKDLQLNFIYWGITLPADTVTWSPSDASISSNHFSMSDSLNLGYYTYTMSIEGTFDPPSSVSGMFSTEGQYDSLGVHSTTGDSLSWTGSHN